MLSSTLSLSISAICTVWLLENTAEAQTHALPWEDDMSDLTASGYWTDFGTVTQSNIKCVGSSPCVQLFGYSELYFLHFSLAEHSTIYIGFNLCFDCDSTSPAADAEHFNVYYSCGPSQFVAPEWAVLKQYDGTLPTGTMFEGERLALPASCDNAADLNLAFISFTASSSMYIDSLLITTPTMSPSVSPSRAPSRSPSRTPSRSPTTLPSRTPTSSPTAPTASPTSETAAPSMVTNAPSTSPSKAPSKMPSVTPSTSPTVAPTTSNPTAFPSDSPSSSPTNAPLATPTMSPSKFPTISPTEPTQSPSAATPSPTEVTDAPTAVTGSPSVSPTTSEPTYGPTAMKETNEMGGTETPSPVMIQFVFIREPTMAPTNGVVRQSTVWMVVTVMVMVWTLF